MSTLTARFRSKGREYSLSLDAACPDRNYDDENYAEWFVKAEDGRILEVTVWKDGLGWFTQDGTAEVYADKGAFEDGLLLDKKHIKLKEQDE